MPVLETRVCFKNGVIVLLLVFRRKKIKWPETSAQDGRTSSSSHTK